MSTLFLTLYVVIALAGVLALVVFTVRAIVIDARDPEKGENSRQTGSPATGNTDRLLRSPGRSRSAEIGP